MLDPLTTSSKGIMNLYNLINQIEKEQAGKSDLMMGKYVEYLVVGSLFGGVTGVKNYQNVFNGY